MLVDPNGGPGSHRKTFGSRLDGSKKKKKKGPRPHNVTAPTSQKLKVTNRDTAWNDTWQVSNSAVHKFLEQIYGVFQKQRHG